MEMYQIKRGNKVRGPYSREIIFQGIAEGKLLASDMISIDGDDEWQKLGSYKTFRDGFPKNNQEANKGEELTTWDYETTKTNLGSILKRFAPIFVISIAVITISSSLFWKMFTGNKKNEEVVNQEISKFESPLNVTNPKKQIGKQNQKDIDDYAKKQPPGMAPSPVSGRLIDNVEFYNSFLKQSDQNQLAKVYANIPKENRKDAREYIALKATSSEPNTQVTVLKFLEKVIEPGDVMPDEMDNLMSNSNPLVREAAFRFLFKNAKNLEQKWTYSKGATGDQDERVISVGIDNMSALRSDKRALVLTELFNLCGSPFQKVRSKAEEQLLLLFKPFGLNDLNVLNEIKKNKGIFVQAALAKVFGLFDQPNNDLIKDLEVLAKSPEPFVSIEAIKSLSVYGPKSEGTVQTLINLLTNKNPDVRKEVFVCLAKISKEPKVISLVVEGIGDPNEDVSKTCLDVVEEVKKIPGSFSVMVVENNYESSSQKVREAAFEILVKNGKGKQEYSSIAIKGLEDKSEIVNRLSLLFLQDLKNLDTEAYKKLVIFLDSNANRVDQAKLVPICLRLLKNGKKHSKDSVSVLKTMLTIRQEQEVRDEVFALIEAIGPDASQLVDELIKNVSFPEIQKSNPQNQNAKQNQFQITNLATYRRIFLENGENEKIRKAISFLGKPGAKEVGKYLSNQDPAIRFFALVCIQSLGKEAIDQLPNVYKLTLAINEKVPFILQQARETYGTIK